jgi:hypothetical protein
MDGYHRFLNLGWEKRLKKLKESLDACNNGPVRVWVAECHADIVRIVSCYGDRHKRIIHMDYHSDDYQWDGLCCGSWRYYIPSGIHVEYYSPDDFPSNLECTDVFICRSSPWTPPALDDFFWGLVHHISRKMTVVPKMIGHRNEELQHEWERAKEKQPRLEVPLIDSYSMGDGDDDA